MRQRKIETGEGCEQEGQWGRNPAGARQNGQSRCQGLGKLREAGLGGGKGTVLERGREHLQQQGRQGEKKGRKGIRAKVSSISQICPGSLQANLLSGCTSLNSF